MLEKIKNVFANFMKLIGYEKVVVVRVKKTEKRKFYDPDRDEILVFNEYRKRYSVIFKNVIFNVKNYAKYLLKMDYRKIHDNSPYFTHVYKHMPYNTKKNDFAVLSKHMVDESAKPRASFTKIGTIEKG